MAGASFGTPTAGRSFQETSGFSFFMTPARFSGSIRRPGLWHMRFRPRTGISNRFTEVNGALEAELYDAENRRKRLELRHDGPEFVAGVGPVAGEQLSERLSMTQGSSPGHQPG